MRRFLLVLALASGCSFTTDFSGLSGGADGGGVTPIDAGYPVAGPVEPLNLYGLRRIRPEFDGNCLQLRRKSDNQLRDFGFDSRGQLDVAAIETWAGGSSVLVVRWYDQTADGRHARPVFSDNKGGGDAGIADQPELVLAAADGKPAVRFFGSRMDAVSPLDGRTSQTLFACFNPASIEQAQRLISWAFVEQNVFPNNRGQWQLTADEPAAPLEAGIEAGKWHAYAARWRANAASGRQTFRDAMLLDAKDTTAARLTFQYRDNVNLGWFRWDDGQHFGGDVRELHIYGSALSDADLTALFAALPCVD